MDWLYRLLSLVALVIKLLDKTIKLISKARGYIRERRKKGRHR